MYQASALKMRGPVSWNLRGMDVHRGSLERDTQCAAVVPAALAGAVCRHTAPLQEVFSAERAPPSVSSVHNVRHLAPH